MLLVNVSMRILALSLDWLNYPGLELWKFANLAIFIGVAFWLVGGRLSEALRSRGEKIRQELLRAAQERDVAQASLAEAESLLSRLDGDVQKIREQSHQEAKMERQRLQAATENEIEKMRAQGQREIEMARKIAWKELREFLALRSVEVATRSIRSRLRYEDDAHLIEDNVGELRRSRV